MKQLILCALVFAACKPQTADVPLEPNPVPEPSQTSHSVEPEETAAPTEAGAEQTDSATSEVQGPSNDEAATPPVEPPRNVIFLIADGMGPVHERAASLYLHGEPGQLRMHAAPVSGTMTTHAADVEITDSAASATAFATGQKANYEAVSVHPETGEPLRTVLEDYQAAGYATGLVTTSRISHATPAAFYAHVPSRYDERIIADQLLERRPTLVFGGGTPGLTQRRLTAAGYTATANEAGMRRLGMDDAPWAMIYGRDHLPFVSDGLGTAPELAEMTETALRLLVNSEPGFFLMIEGARIDHASHNNDFIRMLPEMAGFDDAVGVVLEWAAERDDTLVFLTSDHECGGLEIVTEAPRRQLSEVTWSTTGHTAVPVNFYAWGPFAHRAASIEDNVDVYSLIRWPLE